MPNYYRSNINNNHQSPIPDIPVHPVEVLPVAGGVARHPLRPGHRHVVAGLHTGRDAHGGAAVQRRQRGGPDEQDCRGVGHAAGPPPRSGEIAKVSYNIYLFIR